MVPTQDIALLATQISTSFPSSEYLPAGVVGVALTAFAVSLVLVSFRRGDVDR